MSDVVAEADALLAAQADMRAAVRMMRRAERALDAGALPAAVAKPLADLLAIQACNLEGAADDAETGMRWGSELWRDVAAAVLRLAGGAR